MPQVYQRLREYINLALGFSIAIGFALLSRDRLFNLYQSDPATAALSTALALVTFAELVWYWRAVTSELDLLNDAFDETRLKVMPKGPTLTIGAGLGLAFGVLIAASTNILLYAAALSVYQVFDSAGQSTVNHNVATMYRDVRFKGGTGEAKARILYQYYLERPLLFRCVGLLFMYSTGFALAVAGAMSAQKWYSYIAYALIIVTVPLGEWLIYSWRRVRDHGLAQIERGEDAPVFAAST